MAYLYNIATNLTGNSYVYQNWGKTCEVQFVDYILAQESWEDLFTEIKESDEKIQGAFTSYRQNFLDTYGIELSCSSEAYKRIMFENYCLSKQVENKLTKFHKYFKETSDLFDRIVNRFEFKKDSPHLLGNNWRLQKIFSNHKYIKAKQQDPKYVLTPLQVDTITNNYFLYIKCGWTPDEA
jgi:hypothetical protein